MEQMVTSRPLMMALTPSGRSRAEIWMVSLMSSLETSTSDRVGNVVGRADHVHLMAHDVQHAALLQARRFALALEVHGNFQTHGSAFGQAHEIDMHGAVADRVQLQLAGNDAGLLAGDVQHQAGW